VLVAADADWVIDAVQAALGGRGTTFTVCRQGQEVVPAAMARLPELAVLDLQIGNMGGMAACMALRLDESGGRIAHVPVLMLLDRKADVHLARRSDAEGWLIKPLDPLRLRKAATTILEGGTYTEGVPAEPAAVAVAEPLPDDSAEDDVDPSSGESPAGEPATTR
jgi:CheY-like chemotaxis protein